MPKLSRAAWLIAVIAVFAFTETTVWSATGGEQKTGYVDVKRVGENAPLMRQYSEELDAFSKSLSADLELRYTNMMLDTAEIKELIDLKAKAKPSDTENARIKTLTDSAKARADELSKLQQTKDLTDQQKARLQELQDAQKRSAKAGEAIQKDYRSQLDKKSKETWDKADSEMRAAISKVAAAKGFQVVLAKEIQISEDALLQVLLFGGTDITDDVIKQLDRKH